MYRSQSEMIKSDLLSAMEWRIQGEARLLHETEK